MIHARRSSAWERAMQTEAAFYLHRTARFPLLGTPVLCSRVSLHRARTRLCAASSHTALEFCLPCSHSPFWKGIKNN